MIVVEASSGLDIVRDVWIQRLAFRGDPIDDRAFHPLGVICSSIISTFLNLKVSMLD